jgi:hypothetical protein
VPPRRKVYPRYHPRSWWEAIAKPQVVASMIALAATWLETHHHTDKVESDAATSRQALWHHVLEVERRADSLSVRVRYLQWQVGRIQRHAPLRAADSDPYGPQMNPTPREEGLSHSLAKAFHGLFSWLGSS